MNEQGALADDVLDLPGVEAPDVYGSALRQSDLSVEIHSGEGFRLLEMAPVRNDHEVADGNPAVVDSSSSVNRNG